MKEQISKITEDEVANLFDGLMVGTITLPQATDYINSKLEQL